MPPAAPPPPTVDFHFVAEPFDDVPGHDHAVLATALGPAFLLAPSGGRSAGERALQAAQRLNDAAGRLKASRDADLELRDPTGEPVIGLVGRPEPVLEISEADAAAFAEDWSHLGGKGGPVTRERLARWWLAVARDLCAACPVKDLCLVGALERHEPHGVWGGQIFLNGVVVDRKPPRGRPRKDAA